MIDLFIITTVAVIVRKFTLQKKKKTICRQTAVVTNETQAVKTTVSHALPPNYFTSFIF